MTDSNERGTSLAQLHKIKAIHCLFESDERLLQFLFHHKKTGLREPVDELLKEARGLSCEEFGFNPSEFLVIQCAIDLWCDRGGALFSDILTVLDDSKLLKLMRAIAQERGMCEVEEALECCDL